MKPGKKPFLNNLVTLCSAITAYRTMGTDGGMTTPIHPPEAIKAAARSTSYPLFSSSGSIDVPTAAVVAAPEPDIAAKNMDANTETADNPPLILPIHASAKATSIFDISPLASKSPAKIKKGIATKENESDEANKRCTTIKRFTSPAISTTTPATATEKAMGTPNARHPKNVKSSILPIIPPPPL
jgi:hypothetical protein